MTLCKRIVIATISLCHIQLSEVQFEYCQSRSHFSVHARLMIKMLDLNSKNGIMFVWNIVADSILHIYCMDFRLNAKVKVFHLPRLVLDKS